MQASVSKTSTGFLGGSIFAYLSIAGIAAFLGFSDNENKPVDEESNTTANTDAVKKQDEVRKTEANSPI